MSRCCGTNEPQILIANQHGIIFDRAVECAGCHTMHYFFRSVGGRTRCLDCAAEQIIAPTYEATP